MEEKKKRKLEDMQMGELTKEEMERILETMKVKDKKKVKEIE